MRYIIGFFVTIVLIVLLIVLLVTGGNDKPKVPNTTKTLESYASSQAVASLTIDGPINAPENHRAIRISVSRDNTTYEELSGYNNNVTKSQLFPNTESSYRSFLRAIELAGFTKGKSDKALENERGFCPLGNRYVFQLEENGQKLERYWSTNCSGTKTYEGNTSLTVTLFQRQVPGYSKLTNTFSFFVF